MNSLNKHWILPGTNVFICKHAMTDYMSMFTAATNILYKFFFFFFCHLLFVYIGESLPLALTLHRDMIDRCKILVVGVVRGIYIYIWVAYSRWKKNKEDKKIHFPRILSIRVNRIFFAVMETLWLGWHKGSSSKRPS